MNLAGIRQKMTKDTLYETSKRLYRVKDELEKHHCNVSNVPHIAVFLPSLAHFIDYSSNSFVFFVSVFSGNHHASTSSKAFRLNKYCPS
jgi:hypothetical protein